MAYHCESDVVIAPGDIGLGWEVGLCEGFLTTVYSVTDVRESRKSFLLIIILIGYY